MIRSYSVNADDDGSRLDRWIKRKILNIPQSLIEKSLRAGKIKVNKKKIKSSYKIKKNDFIELFNLKYQSNVGSTYNFNPSHKLIKFHDETVINDNENFIVLNKRPGISVQGGTKSKKNLIDIFAKSNFFVNTKPYTVHRIDKETSGIFIIAKNRKTAQLLTSLFRLRKIHKTYFAICHGVLQHKEGILKNSLIRYEKNRQVTEEALSKYKVIDSNSNFTLLEISPITGRKHQLRKQLSLIGHPIIGDKKYSFLKKNFKNLMLHAYGIKFKINKKKYNFFAELPDYFNKFLDQKYIKF